METQYNNSSTPVLDAIAANPDFLGTRQFLIDKLNRRLHTTDWVEIPKSPELANILTGLKPQYNIYKSEYYLKGYQIEEDHLAWIESESYDTLWIRSDVLDKYYPDWAIKFLFDRW